MKNSLYAVGLLTGFMLLKGLMILPLQAQAQVKQPEAAAVDFVTMKLEKSINWLGAQAFSAAKFDRNLHGLPLRIGAKIFKSGIATHANSELPLNLPQGSTHLRGKVGVDDNQGAGKGSVVFRILSGSRVLWSSKTLKSGEPAVEFEVPLQGLSRVYLQAQNVDGDEFDHANWVDLQLGRSKVAAKAAVQQVRVEGARFGLQAGSGKDMTAAMAAAVDFMRQNPGSVLVLAKGRYEFTSTQALQRYLHISNHDQVSCHPVGINLVDVHDVSIEGNGSEFIFDGQMLPVLVLDSSKITLKNLHLDFKRPHHSQLKVLAVNADGSYDAAIDAKEYPYTIENGWMNMSGSGWKVRADNYGFVFRGESRRVPEGSGDALIGKQAQQLEQGKLRISGHGMGAYLQAGDAVTVRHSSRPHPGVVLYRAKDVLLEDCFIHQAAGMGLLAQRSQNISMQGGGVCLAENTSRRFTTNADATHFSNCGGAIKVQGALFEGMMDDAINVHSTCLRVEKIIDKQTFIARMMHGQAYGFEVMLPGENIQFIQAPTLSNYGRSKVVELEKLDSREICVKVAGALPPGLQVGDAVENFDWHASVVFNDNMVRNNRARGSLFTTPKKVEVKGNVFDHSSGSAILLAGDANGWYEAGACGDVLIKNNLFINNLTSRYQFTEAVISAFPEIPDLKSQKQYYHRNLQIVDNRFITHDVPLLFAISLENINFSGNSIVYNKDFGGWNKAPFILRRVGNIKVSGNKVFGANKFWQQGQVFSAELCEPARLLFEK